jgi:hypothetical protein
VKVLQDVRRRGCNFKKLMTILEARIAILKSNSIRVRKLKTQLSRMSKRNSKSSKIGYHVFQEESA